MMQHNAHIRRHTRQLTFVVRVTPIYVCMYVLGDTFLHPWSPFRHFPHRSRCSHLFEPIGSGGPHFRGKRGGKQHQETGQRHDLALALLFLITHVYSCCPSPLSMFLINTHPPKTGFHCGGSVFFCCRSLILKRQTNKPSFPVICLPELFGSVCLPACLLACLLACSFFVLWRGKVKERNWRGETGGGGMGFCWVTCPLPYSHVQL
ncbi:hypothetical protein V8C42DRAFT_28234 [Trichoderma barbatum]